MTSSKVFSLLVFFLAVATSSCNSTGENRASIYFFDLKEMTTIETIECGEIKNMNGVFKLALNQKLTNQIENIIEINASERDYYPDVRFRVELNDKRFICLDYMGNFITNSGNRGQTKIINELEDYILKNITNAEIVNKKLEAPWDD